MSAVEVLVSFTDLFLVSTSYDLFLSAYSRLGVATADICIFYDMAFVLRSDALPVTNPLFRRKTGPPIFHIKVGVSR